MLKIENTEIFGFESAIRGMRNPMNSWDKSDSGCCDCNDCFHVENKTEPAIECNNGKFGFCIGENDFDLMKKLVNAGSDHSKFMRMINVTMDITAPLYWVAELDTYKVGTVRNSCSLQHKGASRPFTIRDFSVQEELYEILDPAKKKKEHFPVFYNCNESDFKIYTVGDRNYKIFKNGKIRSCAYTRTDSVGNRIKSFKEREIVPTQSANGYYALNLGGRHYLERTLLHRLVAKVWLSDSKFPNAEVNHKDGNKGNNNVENLEWVTHQENNSHKCKNGLSGRTLCTDYIAFKNASKKSPTEQMNNETKSVNHDLFCLAAQWEELLQSINGLREAYIDTDNYDYFLAMRQLIPMSYNYRFTWQANYAVLRHIYLSRKNHRLPEWHDFCHWIKTLPYSELIIMEEK